MERPVAKEEKHLLALRGPAAPSNPDTPPRPLRPRPRLPRGATPWVAALAALGILACSDASAPPAPGTPPGSPAADVQSGLPPRGPFSADASPDVTESLRADLTAPRHAADGGGRAWLETALQLEPDGSTQPAPRNADGDPVFTAGSPGRFQLVYEAGPEGVAANGMVFLQVSPFWDWDDPQTAFAEGPGYTTVRTTAEGVELDAFQAAAQLLAIRIGGRALASGERIEIVYGAGPAGARVDRYAEHHTRLWFAVDGDGDGIRGLVPDPPGVTIEAAGPALLVVTVPTTARPGDAVRVNLAIVDRAGNAGFPWQGEVSLDPEDGLELPERVAFAPADRGRTSVSGRALRAGTYRLHARIESEDGPADFQSNPLVVREGIRRVLWGDLHGHSETSPTARACPRTTTTTRATSPPSTWPRSPITTTGACASSTRTRDVAGDPDRGRELERAGALRDPPGLRVDELATGPPPRALLRGRRRGPELARPALPDARRAVGGAAGQARAHVRPPLRGRPDRDELELGSAVPISSR